MNGRFKKPVIAIALIILIAAGGHLFQSLTKSDLIKKIEKYEKEHVINDISPVVKDDIVEGMPIEDAIRYFSGMGFSIHKNWRYQNTHVASFQSPIFWPLVIKSYRFSLWEEDGKLLHYEGSVSVEGP